MDKVLISEVKKNSIAKEVEIEVNDYLVSINGFKINDIIEYKYLITDEKLLLVVEKTNKDIWEIEIEKEYDEDLGLVFENTIIDQTKGCQNKCIFCFIDQLPKGLRKTLYFKDDDTRLSFLQGNYVTLTNMNEEEIARVIKYRINPINISVHTTNPDLRKTMLNNKNAGKILEIMRRFASARLIMNTQIVLCPNVNDQEELDKTIQDLSALYPYVKSISVVPVGISKYRQGLFPMKEFTKKEAQKILRQISYYQKIMLKNDSVRFVFPSDEFIIKAEQKIPEIDYYEGFEQLENGVGMLSLFKKQIKESLNNIQQEPKSNNISVITGELAYPYMMELMQKIMTKWKQLNIQVYPIKNNFFGEKITVSGLVTGQDMISQLKGKDLGKHVFIPRSMLKAEEEEDIFLDDYSIEEVSKNLSVPVYPIEVEGEILIKKMLSINNV